MTGGGRCLIALWILITILTMLFPPNDPERARFRQQTDATSGRPSAIIPASFFFLPAR